MEAAAAAKAAKPAPASVGMADSNDEVAEGANDVAEGANEVAADDDEVAACDDEVAACEASLTHATSTIVDGSLEDAALNVSVFSLDCSSVGESTTS